MNDKVAFHSGYMDKQARSVSDESSEYNRFDPLFYYGDDEATNALGKDWHINPGVMASLLTKFREASEGAGHKLTMYADPEDSSKVSDVGALIKKYTDLAKSDPGARLDYLGQGEYPYYYQLDYPKDVVAKNKGVSKVYDDALAQRQALFEADPEWVKMNKQMEALENNVDWESGSEEELDAEIEVLNALYRKIQKYESKKYGEFQEPDTDYQMTHPLHDVAWPALLKERKGQIMTDKVAFYSGYMSKSAGLEDIWNSIRNSQYYPHLKRALPGALMGAAAGGLGSIGYDLASGGPMNFRRALLLSLLGGAGGGAYGAYNAYRGFNQGPTAANLPPESVPQIDPRMMSQQAPALPATPQFQPPPASTGEGMGEIPLPTPPVNPSALTTGQMLQNPDVMNLSYPSPWTGNEDIAANRFAPYGQ